MNRAEALAQQFDQIFAKPSTPPVTGAKAVLAVRVATDPYVVKLEGLSGLAVDRKVVPLAGPHPALLGLIGYRAAVYPAYSLRALLGYPPSAEAPRWFMFAAGAEAVAFAFDAFEQQLKLLPAAFSSAASSPRPFVREVANDGALLRPVIDVSSVVQSLVNWEHRNVDLR